MKKHLKEISIFVLLLVVVVGCSTTDAKDNNNQEKNTENNNALENETNNEQQVYNPLEELDSNFEASLDPEETRDEDLKLKEIYGAANGINEVIEYDDDRGYYILDLQAGLTNFYSKQDLKEKWVAFAIPDGVSVPNTEDVPSGVVVVSLPDGHSGIAVKTPNLQGLSDETLYLEIPLIGEPNDNDPNENLYLYNVDGNEHKAALIGEISSTRDIDFSVMTEETTK